MRWTYFVIATFLVSIPVHAKKVATQITSPNIKASSPNIIPHSHNEKPKPRKRVTSKQLQSDLSDESGAVTLNTESNIYGNAGVLNTMVDYSYKNWDIGISTYNIPMYNTSTYPGDFFLTVSKSFQLFDNLQFVVGIQNGVQIFSKQSSWQTYNYIETDYTFNKWVTAGIGVYVANKAMTGDVTRVGVQLDGTVQVIPNVLELQGMYVSGYNNISGGTITLAYKAMPNFQVYVGILTPPVNNVNAAEFIGVVGFNLSTQDL